MSNSLQGDLRRCGVLILFLSCRLFAEAVDPPGKVHFSGKNVRLQVVVDSVFAQTGYGYNCTDSRLLDLVVSIDLPELPLADFLTLAFRKTPVAWTIGNKYIVLTWKKPLPVPGIDVDVTVMGDSNQPLADANISIKGSHAHIRTDSKGQAHFAGVDPGAELLCTYVGMDDASVKVDDNKEVVVHMVRAESMLTAVINDGYQRIGKERATGSVALVGNKQYSRLVFTDWSSSLQNVASGLLFNLGGKSASGKPAPDPMVIHGRSTLYSNPAPLIIVDDFPYDGDLNNINPNDIDNITILKDAAAASIWGVRAGNGVIVITTKKGRTAAPQVVLTSTVTYSPRPALSNLQLISGSDGIDFETNICHLGYTPPSTGNLPITPVMALLQAVSSGSISVADGNQQIALLRKQSVQDEISRDLYRGSVNRQHYVQVSGQTPFVRYNFSGGWDHNLANLSESQYDRMTLRMQNTFTLNSCLQADVGLWLTQQRSANGNNPGYGYINMANTRQLYPYTQLADAHGNALPVNLYYNQAFQQQALQSGLLNWAWSPLSELNAEKNLIVTNDRVIRLGTRYRLSPSLSLEAKYQYETQSVVGNDLHRDSSYYVRDLINSFTQVDPATGLITRPIPTGGILDMNQTDLVSQQARIQANYHRYFHDDHELTAIGGYEVKSIVTTTNNNRYYGYDPDSRQSDPALDYSTPFPQYGAFNSQSIPTALPATQTTGHFISWFGNAAYTYAGKYTLSASGRKDLANLFGVSTNNNDAPLWSTGLAWKVDTGKFFHPPWLGGLRLRATYGSNGNLSQLASAYTTAAWSVGGFTGTPYSTGILQSLANTNLRWEQVRVLNFGVDLSTADSVLTVTAEYYRKSGVDIIAQTAADPTLGLIQAAGGGSYYFGNSAGIRGQGMDVTAEARLIRGRQGGFSWTANGIYSYTRSAVTSYSGPIGGGSAYLDPYSVNPLKGRPVFAVYSFPWKGLDAKTGDPIGHLQGQDSKSWTDIYTTTPIDGMVYNGPAQPVSFGALLNTFGWKAFSLSFSISYKFGYYMREPGINYYNLLTYWNGSNEYGRRWQHPGDEEKTHVPSLVYPLDPNRDYFYTNSSALVVRADNIRLEDLRLDYTIARQLMKKLPFRELVVYGIVTNLALLWTANKEGIDPNYLNVPRDGRHISLGATVHF